MYSNLDHGALYLASFLFFFFSIFQIAILLIYLYIFPLFHHLITSSCSKRRLFNIRKFQLVQYLFLFLFVLTLCCTERKTLFLCTMRCFENFLRSEKIDATQLIQILKDRPENTKWLEMSHWTRCFFRAISSDFTANCTHFQILYIKTALTHQFTEVHSFQEFFDIFKVIKLKQEEVGPSIEKLQRHIHGIQAIETTLTQY